MDSMMYAAMKKGSFGRKLKKVANEIELTVDVNADTSREDRLIDEDMAAGFALMFLFLSALFCMLFDLIIYDLFPRLERSRDIQEFWGKQ
jgi:hypothetical protein